MSASHLVEQRKKMNFRVTDLLACALVSAAILFFAAAYAANSQRD